MELADVLDALVYHQKQVSYHHAQRLRALADYAIACEGDEFADAEIAAQVEERVLTKAADQIGAQLRNLTDRAVMRLDPEGARERAEERKQRRCMDIDSKKADMARLWAHLPANLATACYDRVDEIARQAQLSAQWPDDPRTLDQICADVVADLLLATPARPARSRSSCTSPSPPPP